MASGKNHDFLNLISLPIFLYGVPHQYFIYFGSAYVLSTVLLSPDIDLHHSKPSKRWKMFKVFWYPYRKIFKHRGLSHAPIFGTITRHIYFAIVLILIYILTIYILKFLGYSNIMAKYTEHILIFIKRITTEEALWFILGAVMADIVHIFWDIVFSVAKRIKRIFKIF